MKTLALAILALATLAPAAHAADAIGAAITVLSGMDFTEATSHKYTNVNAVQADAALLVAGGAASASLSEVFADLRSSHEELNGLSDKELAEQLLAALAN